MQHQLVEGNRPAIVIAGVDRRLLEESPDRPIVLGRRAVEDGDDDQVQRRAGRLVELDQEVLQEGMERLLPAALHQALAQPRRDTRQDVGLVPVIEPEGDRDGESVERQVARMAIEVVRDGEGLGGADHLQLHDVGRLEQHLAEDVAVEDDEIVLPRRKPGLIRRILAGLQSRDGVDGNANGAAAQQGVVEGRIEVQRLDPPGNAPIDDPFTLADPPEVQYGSQLSDVSRQCVPYGDREGEDHQDQQAENQPIAAHVKDRHRRQQGDQQREGPKQHAAGLGETSGPGLAALERTTGREVSDERQQQIGHRKARRSEQRCQAAPADELAKRRKDACRAGGVRGRQPVQLALDQLQPACRICATARPVLLQLRQGLLQRRGICLGEGFAEPGERPVGSLETILQDRLFAPQSLDCSRPLRQPFELVENRPEDVIDLFLPVERRLPSRLLQCGDTRAPGRKFLERGLQLLETAVEPLDVLFELLAVRLGRGRFQPLADVCAFGLGGLDRLEDGGEPLVARRLRSGRLDLCRSFRGRFGRLRKRLVRCRCDRARRQQQASEKTR